jgi:hypothetical protein
MINNEFIQSLLKDKKKGDTIRRAVLIGKLEQLLNIHPRYSRSIIDAFLTKQVALGRIERYDRGVYKII